MTRRRLSVKAIVAATLELGIGSATTGSVARSLGVEQPALYRHVASKADLLDMAAATALEGLEAWQPGPDPSTAIAAFQRALWRQLDAHRGLARHLLTTSELPVPLQDAAARLVGAIRSGGPLAARDAILVVDAVAHLTCLAHAGSERLRNAETALRWHERSRQIGADDLILAVSEIEDTDPLDLAIEQVRLLTGGLLGTGRTDPDHR